MSTTRRESVVQNEAQLRQLLRALPDPDAPAILLSASVPYRRQEDAEMSADEWAMQVQANQRYMATAHPERIRLAVKELTESALMRRMRVIFGAHPAISPMVLEAAKSVGAAADSILIFQSEIYRNQLPSSTLQLADWSAGRLIFTPERRVGIRKLDTRRRSLTEMRSLMCKPPTLRGAVFIGGMEGTEEEAQIIENERGELPCYALANTGSAALDLYQAKPTRFSGTLSAQDRKLLQDYPVSFKLVARRILDDLGVAAAPTSGP